MSSHKFTKEQVADFTEHFNEVDTDKSGEIDKDELKELMHKSGADVSEEQIATLMKENSKADKSGLDLEDFLNLMWKFQSGPGEKEIRSEIFAVSTVPE